MRAIAACALLCFSSLALADPGAGDPAAPAPPPAAPSPRTLDITHYHQFGLAVTFGTGYLIRFKYASATYCDGATDPGKNTCYDRLPTWMDVKAFFGVTRAIDVLLEQRFGLESDFTKSHNFLFMPGIRVYPEPAKPFKFYVQVQGVLDFTDWGGVSSHGIDFGIHEANGFQWDFWHYMGAYLQISETFEFLRSLAFQLEAGIGVEGRFP